LLRFGGDGETGKDDQVIPGGLCESLVDLGNRDRPMAGSEADGKYALGAVSVCKAAFGVQRARS